MSAVANARRAALSYETRRRREYEARRRAAEVARWSWTASGYECPGCRVTGPHSVYRFAGELLEVECGSDWCGREFSIAWKGPA